MFCTNQLDHEVSRRFAERLIHLRRRYTVQADRHITDFDGVSIPYVRDYSGKYRLLGEREIAKQEYRKSYYYQEPQRGSVMEF